MDPRLEISRNLFSESDTQTSTACLLLKDEERRREIRINAANSFRKIPRNFCFPIYISNGRTRFFNDTCE